jgi:ribosomal protein S18 acetylase RimI-like enzyme
VALDAVCSWYRERERPPMVAVPFGVAGPSGSAVDQLLVSRGWSGPQRPTMVMTASPARIADQLPAKAPPVIIADTPDEDWLSLYHQGQALPPAARQVLVSAPWQAFASVRAYGRTIAIGRVAASEGWAGLTAIEVHPACRRHGLGTAVTAVLAGLAAARGVTGLYLQVEAGNGAARAMYTGMGFADHHRYHYRVDPAG